MRTCPSVLPQSSGRGAGRSRYWVRNTPAEPGSPTITSWVRAIAPNHTGSKKTAHNGVFWAAGAPSAGFGADISLLLPGELDHATGPEEATIDNPKGQTGPRSDSTKVECQYCGCWKGLRRVATLLCCGSGPLGVLLP